jgi:ketopantoate reductase
VGRPHAHRSDGIGWARRLFRRPAGGRRANTVGLPDDYADDRLGFIDTLHPEMMASMAHDLLNGNRLELPWLSGGVVGLGERAGVPTPLNRAVRDVLALYSDGGGPGRPT